MREIKFRVWDGEQMVSPDYINRDGTARWKCNSIPQFSDDLMQFTGLQDANGVDIYEGDKYIWGSKKQEEGRIEFIGGSFRCYCERTKNAFPIESMYATIEVVGNIHENK